MANVQAAVRALSESGIPAADLIEKVNSLVHRSSEESAFITFFYCVLNTETGHLRYVNAGHNPPCVLRSDGSKEYFEKGGVVIGIMPGMKYEEGEAVLHPGDAVALYTDGITEATNPRDEMYGEERLESVLEGSRHASAREIEERVYNDVKDFTEGAAQSDDLTMVVVKVTGEASEGRSVSYEESPQKADGGPSAARGAPAMGGLRGSTEASLV
jgi:sigma-B regulation protein RsbU (phosphoserine phosphatase)